MPTPISPAIIGEHEKFLLYGDAKMGKTFCALTLPEPIYFVTFMSDNEAKTYYSKEFQKKHGKKEIYIDVAKESGEDGFGKLKKATGSDHMKQLIEDALENEANGTGPEFASIIIDNATRMGEFQMNKAIQISHMHTQDSGKSTAKTAFQKYAEHGIMAPYDSDWGAAQSIMKKIMSELYALDKHLVVIAHEYKETQQNRATQQSELIGVKPQFVGKLRNDIAGLFDNVWRFTKEAQFYVARTEPLGSPYSIIAGSRIGGVIPKDYQNPDLTEAIRKFRKYAETVQ